MARNIVTAVMLFLSAFATLSFKIPKGWYKGGNAVNKYAMGIDSAKADNVATIQSQRKHIRGCGMLAQYYSAFEYRGKRIRLSGLMKSRDVKKWAGFWMRIEPGTVTTPIPFDDMHKRPVRGTTGWHRYEIVLDVPDDASYISLGALLSGTGRIWFNDIKIEEVPDSTPTTGKFYTRNKPSYAHWAGSTQRLEIWTLPE